MEQENQKEASPAPAAALADADVAKTEAKGKECGPTGKCCIGNFFKKSYDEHKTAYHVVGGVLAAMVVFHFYSKYRCGGGSGGGCCH